MSIHLTKLPSDILPQVEDPHFAIMETASGRLFWVDSVGAKELATKEEVALIAEEVNSLKQAHEEAMQQLLEAKALYEQAAEAIKTKIL